eukprot:766154-Hanusia_phi.AAC.9
MNHIDQLHPDNAPLRSYSSLQQPKRHGAVSELPQERVLKSESEVDVRGDLDEKPMTKLVQSQRLERGGEERRREERRGGEEGRRGEKRGGGEKRGEEERRAGHHLNWFCMTLSARRAVRLPSGLGPQTSKPGGYLTLLVRANLRKTILAYLLNGITGSGWGNVGPPVWCSKRSTSPTTSLYLAGQLQDRLEGWDVLDIAGGRHST